MQSVLESILMRMCIIRRLRYSVHIFPCWFADILVYVVIQYLFINTLLFIGIQVLSLMYAKFISMQNTYKLVALIRDTCKRC